MSEYGNSSDEPNFFRLNRSVGESDPAEVIDVEPLEVEDEPQRDLSGLDSPPRTAPPGDGYERAAASVAYPKPVVANRISDFDGDMRIGVWGAPRAGKTTFLRAMPLAAKSPIMDRRWTISGVDEVSRKFLIDAVQRVFAGTYPDASRGSSLLAWKLRGTRHRESAGAGAGVQDWLRHLLTRSIVEFRVEVQDVSGEGFDRMRQPQLFAEIVDHLARAKGIVYLFDPVGTRSAETSALKFYYETVQCLREVMESRDLLTEGGQLPHHVSVCVTKLDKPEVFWAAMEANVISQEADGAIPTVPADFAPELLKQLCVDESSQFVYHQLTNDFLPSRVKYFITSAAGFHLMNGRFDATDFTNEQDGRLRSAATPINVLEPIISLQQRIAKTLDGQG